MPRRASTVRPTWTFTWPHRLNADLVTLSACDTGLGAFLPAEDCQGFEQALFLAGARSVVLSLWKVDDKATALLMTRFYQNLLGKRPDLGQPLPKAEALHEAKTWLRGLTAADLRMLTDVVIDRGPPRNLPQRPAGAQVHPFEHPHYWAAFILIGDPG